MTLDLKKPVFDFSVLYYIKKDWIKQEIKSK